MAEPASSLLAGKTALITGAAGGLGREITRGLLAAGARVIATDVDERGLAALAERIGRPKELHTRRLDIADQHACAAAVAAVQDAHGGLDILVNNGALGITVIRDDAMTNLAGIDEITPEVWDRMIAVNLSGAWYLTQAAVPAMRRTGWGRIITVTTSFFTMLRGKFHPYGPAKAGLEAMAAGHAQEFSSDGITVNVVVPGGPADTPMVPASAGFRRADLIPPAKMVPPIVWLCSAEANTVTGKRYVAAMWRDGQPVAVNRAVAEAPIGWPELAQAPVWPGGKPSA